MNKTAAMKTLEVLKNRVSEPEYDYQKNKATTKGGKTAFTEIDNALDILSYIFDETQPYNKPADETIKIKIGDIADIRGYLEQAANERIIMAGLMLELERNINDWHPQKE